MSDRYDPKKVRRARSAAIAAGAPATPAIYPEQQRQAVALAAAPKPTLVDTLCRLHGQPWRTCAACSTRRS